MPNRTSIHLISLPVVFSLTQGISTRAIIYEPKPIILFTTDKHILTLLAGTEILAASTEVTPEITRYGFNKYTNSVVTTPDYITYNKKYFRCKYPYTL